MCRADDWDEIWTSPSGVGRLSVLFMEEGNILTINDRMEFVESNKLYKK
jgi:hypothetical protein